MENFDHLLIETSIYMDTKEGGGSYFTSNNDQQNDIMRVMVYMDLLTSTPHI